MSNTDLSEEDGPCTVQPALYGNPGFGIAAAIRAWGQLQATAIHGDGVVGSNYPPVVTAADACDLFWRGRRPESRLWFSRGFRKPFVEAGQKARQELVCGLDTVNTGESEFDAQSVLQSAPKPFDTSLGLGRTGVDHCNAELSCCPTELSLRGDALELLFERWFRRP